MWSAIADRIAVFLRIRRSSKRPSLMKDDPFSSSDPQIAVLSPDQVSSYLSAHRDFLERYVIEDVELEQLERWIIRKSQRLKKKQQAAEGGAASTSSSYKNSGRKTSLSRWRFCVHADKRQMLQDLTQNLQVRPAKDHVLWELASCICSAVNADGFRLYLPDPLHSNGNIDSLIQYLGDERETSATHSSSVLKEDNNNEGRGAEKARPSRRLKGAGTSVPQHVARTREPVRLSKGQSDARFPDGQLTDRGGQSAHVLCQAVSYPDGQLAAVMEMWRGETGEAFHEEDEEIACSYQVWGGIALHYAHLYLNMDKQRKLNDFLLAVVKSIFQDMVSMDLLVTKVMNFAQKLVDADRASLFLVDSKNRELYATIFDVGVHDDYLDLNEEELKEKLGASKEIRFPLDLGIAGQVATTGEVLNIRDAYSDARFNRTVDQLTGYRTKSILCMPIYIRGSIIGVVQMVNKNSGYFTKEDEEAFQMFAVYCGLALHHAKLYDKIRRSEQKYRVALEVLSYHNSCTEEEVQKVVDDIPETSKFRMDDYYFNPFEHRDYDKARLAIAMFTDLFGLVRFDKQSIFRFTLTVKKNYRRVPYHNWTHGFSVAHCMYCIIKHSGKIFRPNEALALFVGALCHDLDHRGKNNKFMLDTESPLAAIYSTSTMEHHHFNQTVTILQQEGHNIFSKLSNADYKQVLGLIKHCILATDLALFFPNKARLSKILQDDTFSWHNHEHRLLLQAISMTASDLCASAKPWEVQVETVKVIFEEFYQQGDAERKAGRKPIPMMDRNQPDQQASSQVGFLTGICLPCYNLLFALIPQTHPLVQMCQENLDKWREIDRSLQEDNDKLQ